MEITPSIFCPFPLQVTGSYCNLVRYGTHSSIKGYKVSIICKTTVSLISSSVSYRIFRGPVAEAMFFPTVVIRQLCIITITDTRKETLIIYKCAIV